MFEVMRRRVDRRLGPEVFFFRQRDGVKESLARISRAPF
jgi:hypothetical protein